MDRTFLTGENWSLTGCRNRGGSCRQGNRVRQKHRAGFVTAAIAMAICLCGSAFLGAQPAGAEVLFGGVQHSDYLQPPPPATPQAAQPFAPQAQAPRPMVPRIEWFRIPPWMAGKWHKQGDLTVSVTDLRNGMSQNVREWKDNEMTVTWGMLADRAGNIWHANLLPFERDGFASGLEARFLTIAMKCEVSNQNEVVTRTTYHITQTRPGSNQAVNQFLQESINHFTPLPNGSVQNQSSNRDFDMSGSPTQQGTLISTFQKIGPFVPQTSMNGMDLVPSLNQYLGANGMPDLMIIREPSPAYAPY